jgi:type II secretory pathway component PulF
MTNHPPQPLTRREADAVVEAVADATAAGVPLVAGLRAAADEVPRGRLAGTLRTLAGQLEQGRSLEDVLATTTRGLPACVAVVIRAGVRQGTLSTMLVELVDQQRRLREQWRSLRSTLAYPATLIVFGLALAVFLNLFVVRPLIKMFAEFQLTLPFVSQVIVWLHRYGLTCLFGAGLLVLVLSLVLRYAGGATYWRRMLATVPLFGPLWHWTGVAEWARWSALLVDHAVPLPEALRLAADGVHDANVREVGQRLAEGVQQGQSLSELVALTHRLPASLVPLLAWGERSGQLAESLRVSAEAFEERVRQRSELLRAILPPLAFVVVAFLAVLFLVGLYAPMLSMIQGLS